MTRKETTDGIDLRSRLLQAALEILRDSHRPLDLRKVAEQAGKSRTAPYLVFGKESEGGGLAAMRMAVATEGLRSLLREVNAEQELDDPLTAFSNWAEAFFVFAVENRRLFRLMFGPEIGIARSPLPTGSANQSEFESLAAARIELEQSVQRLVELCQDHRYLAAGDNIGKTMASWATLQGIALLLLDDVLHRAGMETTPAQAADIATEAVIGTTRSNLADTALLLLEAHRHKGIMDSEQGSGGRQSSPIHSEQMAATSSGVTEYPQTIQKVLRRALMARTALRNAQILWIDDSPDWIDWEKQVLEDLGVDVTVAQSTEEAIEILASRTFPLIVSDIARGKDSIAGLTSLSGIREAAPDTKVVFYVANLDEEKGTPPGSMGITNRPDELLHLVLDVLERC